MHAHTNKPPEADAMSKKPITTEEKQSIALLAANNRSVTAIARETGLHAQTVKKQLQVPSTIELIEAASKILSEKMLEKADKIISGISAEDIEKAGLRDKAVAAGILMDKARQCYGLDKPATLVNIEQRPCPIDLSGYLNKWSNRLPIEAEEVKQISNN
jgi:transposase-like protein